MNEELQSTNEELETMNDELRQRSLELNEVNDYLELIVTSIGRAVTVLDRDGVVRIWNSHARDLWGLRADEAEGHHFLTLDIGLPVEKLKQPLRTAMNNGGDRIEVSLDAINRRGGSMDCQVTLVPLTNGDGEPATGVLLLMAEPDGAGGDGA